MGITLKQLTDSLETVKTYVDNKAPSGGGSGAGDVYYAYEGYSEEEQVIGEYFGKPLYRKVMKFTTTNTTNEQRFDTNIDNATLVRSYITDTRGTIIPFIHTDSSWNMYLYNVGISGFSIKASANQSAVRTIVAIYEYTKTTDAENSFTPSMITDNKTIISAAPYFEDYSTEEKVIGRYVDGKPVYRKVFYMTNVSVTTTSTALYFNTIASIDKIIKASATFNNKTNDWAYDNASGTQHIKPLYNKDNGFGVYVKDGASAVWPYITATFEYTKTTDAPNSFKPEMITSGIMADEPASDTEVDEIFN